MSDSIVKEYTGRIPACGVFCGGCPTYLKEKKPCPGAEINSARCEGCTKFHLCCRDRQITHCHECSEFPCKKLKTFAKNWLKYGQDFIKNQQMLKEVGEEKFRDICNEKAVRTY